MVSATLSPTMPTMQITIPSSAYPSRTPLNMTPIIGPLLAPLTQRISNAAYSLFAQEPTEDPTTNISTLLDPSSELQFYHAYVRRLAITAPGSKLDGIIIHGSDVTQGPIQDYSPRKLIFFVLGFGVSYGDIVEDPSFVQYFQDEISSKVDIMLIDPRGIGKSSGAPGYDGWVRDVHAGILAAIHLGYPPGSIAVVGHSLGGWISAEAVLMQHAKQADPRSKVAFVAYNAPHNVPDIVRNMLEKQWSYEDQERKKSAATEKAYADFQSASSTDISEREQRLTSALAQINQEDEKSAQIKKTWSGWGITLAARMIGWHAPIASMVAKMDSTRTLIAQADLDEVIPQGSGLYDSLSPKAKPLKILCEGTHNDCPNEQVAAWLQQALGIVRVDAVASIALQQTEASS